MSGACRRIFCFVLLDALAVKTDECGGVRCLSCDMYIIDSVRSSLLPSSVDAVTVRLESSVLFRLVLFLGPLVFLDECSGAYHVCFIPATDWLTG